MSIDENAFTAAHAAYWECNPDRLKSAIEAYIAAAPWDKRPPKIRALSAPDTAQAVAAAIEDLSHEDSTSDCSMPGDRRLRRYKARRR